MVVPSETIPGIVDPGTVVPGIVVTGGMDPDLHVGISGTL